MQGNIVHVCNRGVRKHRIFHDEDDYLRFVYTLYKSNNRPGALRTRQKSPALRLDELPTQDKLVDILKWSALPNHYHLLLYEVVEGGVLEFVKRIGNSYTKYFNTRYDMSGYTFQNAAQIVPAESDGHFFHLPFYVELNSADLAPSKKSASQQIAFMEQYRWSSYRNYALGEPEFERLINKERAEEIFGGQFAGTAKYRKESLEWLKAWKQLPSLEL